MHERLLTSYLTMFPEERAELGLAPVTLTGQDGMREYTEIPGLPGPVTARAVFVTADNLRVILADHILQMPEVPFGESKHDSAQWFADRSAEIYEHAGLVVTKACPLVPQNVEVPVHIQSDVIQNPQFEGLHDMPPEFTLFYAFVANMSSAEEVAFDDPRAKNFAKATAKLQRFKLISPDVRRYFAVS